MKLYKPNKAEWMTFCVLVVFLVAALNYVFFGHDFLKKENDPALKETGWEKEVKVT